MSDSDVITLALGWPRLEDLIFSYWEGTHEGLTGNKRTSNWVVFLLARLCPRLTYLELYINTVSRDNPWLDSSPLPTSEPVHTTYLENQYLDDFMDGLLDPEKREPIFSAYLFREISPSHVFTLMRMYGEAARCDATGIDR
jgi:hypothetical protein